VNAERPHRRASDHGFRRLFATTGEGGEWGPAHIGQLLLVATSVVTIASYRMVGVTPGDLATVNAILVGALVASLFLPWARLPRRTTIIFPVLVWAAIALLGEHAHGAGSNYLGIFVLTFLYIGLVQRPGTSLVLAPVAATMYLGAFAAWSDHLIPRLVIAVIAWVLIAETVATLQQRRADLADRLRQSANTDPLTGLPNRADLEARLVTARPGDLLVVCDINQFKRFNETFGITIADQALADFGFLLRSSVRTVDYASRSDGAQFTLILPRTELALAPAILGRLRRRWTLLRPNITFSTGIACCHPGRTVTETLAAAERALYRAKKAGPNRDHSDIGPLTPASDLELDHGFVVGSVNISHHVR
jgi:diguanylate cyclase (GGDEF)-like protein